MNNFNSGYPNFLKEQFTFTTKYKYKQNNPALHNY